MFYFFFGDGSKTESSSYEYFGETVEGEGHGSALSSSSSVDSLLGLVSSP